MKRYDVFIPSQLIDSNLIICGNEKSVEAAAEEVKDVSCPSFLRLRIALRLTYMIKT